MYCSQGGMPRKYFVVYEKGLDMFSSDGRTSQSILRFINKFVYDK